MPWFKKYAFALVPSVLFVVVSVDVINQPGHREIIEEYVPAYGKSCVCEYPFNRTDRHNSPCYLLVNFVREKYGFKDENLEEKNRVNYVNYIQNQRKCMTV